jgi:hypothetical protein
VRPPLHAAPPLPLCGLPLSLSERSGGKVRCVMAAFLAGTRWRSSSLGVVVVDRCAVVAGKFLPQRGGGRSMRGGGGAGGDPPSTRWRQIHAWWWRRSSRWCGFAWARRVGASDLCPPGSPPHLSHLMLISLSSPSSLFLPTGGRDGGRVVVVVAGGGGGGGR